MDKIITLNNLRIDEKAKIISVDNNLKIKTRLEELGVIKNNTIRCELISPFNDPKAYLIKGSTIAIRNEDAKNIKVMISE